MILKYLFIIKIVFENFLFLPTQRSTPWHSWSIALQHGKLPDSFCIWRSEIQRGNYSGSNDFP